MIVLLSDGAISNIRTTRITKIWTYIIQITSYDDTTVSRTVVFAILTFVIVKPWPTIDTKIILFILPAV
jgi:t-SNARE complex subunit (syntaxin)